MRIPRFSMVAAAAALFTVALASPAAAQNCSAATSGPGFAWLDCIGSFTGNDTGAQGTGLANITSAWSAYGVWALAGKTDDAANGPFTGNPNGATGLLSFDTPVFGIFAVTLKSSNNYSVYLFDGGATGISSLNYNTIGTTTNGNGVAQGLSHATLWNNPASPNVIVPEPASVALVGLGLFGLGVAARRRRKD